MSKFSVEKLISTFQELGNRLAQPDEKLMAVINNEQQYNAWFTPQSVLGAVTAIGEMLNRADLNKWLSRYDLSKTAGEKRVGLILAGNIPLVGFHDLMCVLISGNHALIKASAQDARLIKCVAELLIGIEPAFADQLSFVERLERFDAVIATGSNNTSRYFDYYFGKVPNIIRKNRSSIAILNGNETEDQLSSLGHDIFDYYGLGCRNVSKLLVPEGYDFNFFFESIESFQPIINHHKYNNNYDYNKSIYLVNRDKHLDNGFLLLKEDERLVSPLAVLFYSFYQNIESAQSYINAERDKIQCIVSNMAVEPANLVVKYGESQRPRLWDYADGIDTLEFLSNL